MLAQTKYLCDIEMGLNIRLSSANKLLHTIGIVNYLRCNFHKNLSGNKFKITES